MTNPTKTLLLLTHSFPYGTGETFLADEFPHLARHFHTITIIPLIGNGPSRIENTTFPAAINTQQPLLNFDLKNKKALLTHGLLNTAPLLYALPEYLHKKIYLSPTKTWLFATSLLTTRAIISQNKTRLKQAIQHADTLYSYWGDKTADALPYFKKRIKPFPTTIARFHGSDLYEEAKGYLPFRRRLFSTINLACPISEDGAHYLQQRYPAQIPTIKTFHLGSPNHHLQSPPAQPDQPFHILSCSNIIPLKRLHIIAHALQNATGPIIWTHIGDGYLRKTIQDIKPQNPNITFEMLGWLTRDQLLHYYHTHHIDLFINTSQSEGIPVTIMEALSFGIPVLATNVGGVKEIINPNTGTLLPQDLTPETLLQHIQQYQHTTQKEKDHLRQTALQEWNQKWNADTNYETFATFLYLYPANSNQHSHE